MEKKLFIHVGLPKTGTTSIQRYFSDQECNEGQIKYIESGRWQNKDHHLIAEMFGASIPQGHLAKPSEPISPIRLLDLINSEIREGRQNHYLISSEYILEADFARIKNFFNDIECETEFVITVSNPGKHLISSWSELVRGDNCNLGIIDFITERSYKLQSEMIEKLNSLAQSSLTRYVYTNSNDGISKFLNTILIESLNSISATTEPAERVSLPPPSTEILAKLKTEVNDVIPFWITDYWPSVLNGVSELSSHCLPVEAKKAMGEIVENECKILSEYFDKPLFSNDVMREFEMKYSFVSKSKYEKTIFQVFERFSINEIRTNALAHAEIYRLNYVLDTMQNEQNPALEPSSAKSQFFRVGKEGARFVIAGHSHRGAVEKALNGSEPELRSEFSVITGGLPVDDGPYWDLVAKENGRLCIFWNGNEQNVLSILPDNLFQILIDSDESKEVVGVPVVTKSNLQQYFRDRLNSLVVLLEKISSNSRVIICAPPSPKPRDYLVNVLESEEFFSKRLLEHKNVGAEIIVLSDCQRVAIHEIYLSELKRVAEQSGAIYMESPSRSKTSSGTLKMDYSSNDCTHANEKYGALVIEQLLGMGELL
jgi:hypothetical protein